MESQSRIPLDYISAAPGDQSWQNISQAADADSEGAVCTLDNSEQSEWLHCYSPSWDVPSHAVISSVDLSFESSVTTVATIAIDDIRARVNGVVQGENLLPLSVLPGLIFQPDQSVSIEDSGADVFGVAIRATNMGILTASIYIRSVMMTINYTIAPTKMVDIQQGNSCSVRQNINTDIIIGVTDYDNYPIRGATATLKIKDSEGRVVRDGIQAVSAGSYYVATIPANIGLIAGRQYWAYIDASQGEQHCFIKVPVIVES